jgi:predicted small lipoprotein YifL
MKRILTLMLALATLLSLAACGKEGSFPTSPNATAPSASTGPTSYTKPNKDNSELAELFWRSSYTADDAQLTAARDTVVATLGSATLTNSQLQIFYWMDVYNFLKQYGTAAALYGLDYTKPLDQQTYMDSDGNWQHYFLASAIESWYYYQALSLMADETQTAMEPGMQETLDNIYKELEEKAKKDGFATTDAMIQADAGAGCTTKDYYDYTELCYKGYSYFSKKSGEISITNDMIEEYFTKNKDTLEKNGVTKSSGDIYNVRHILISIDDEKVNKNWDECQKEAQKLLDEWLAGEATEETFAALASKHSADGGSSSNGGLYEGLNDKTNFVQEFKDWYLDKDRRTGDYGLVKSTYGYHIMYFSGSEAQWIYQCREALHTELTTEFVTEAMDKFTLSVKYENIFLDELDLK